MGARLAAYCANLPLTREVRFVRGYLPDSHAARRKASPTPPPMGTKRSARSSCIFRPTHQRLAKKQVVDELTAVVGKDQEKGIMGFMEEWMEEGRQAGQANMLLRQLAARFGPVPSDAQARVQAADEATLTHWSIRVLTESTLGAVLDSAPAKAARPAKKAASATKQHARASRR